MHRLSTIAFMGMLAWTMAGCGAGSEENSAATPPAPQASSAKPFDKPPMVNQNPGGTIASVPGLIQSTNANQRSKQVQKGRVDPFALLFVQAVETVPNTATRSKIVPRLPKSPNTATRPKIVPQLPKSPSKTVALRPGSYLNGGNAGSNFKPGRGNLLPPVVPGSTSSPALPPPPPLLQPDLARTVAITGVVQVGSEPQAIIKVPNEATSRYVKVGQRLANGQVLVKRIEINEGADPIVILEQYGIEVGRAVGEEPVNSAQAATPAAAISAPPPPSNNTPDPGV